MQRVISAAAGRIRKIGKPAAHQWFNWNSALLNIAQSSCFTPASGERAAR
jgi:hypothetical protein